VLGLFHFWKSKLLENYAVDRGILNPTIAIRMSGVLLMLSGVALQMEEYRMYALYALTAFLVLSALIIHKFWDDTDPKLQLREFMNFIKNFIILAALWALLG
ncbi:MAG: hypothetical protein OEQ53_22755, partial [Saprospiraceae bacterium]|nr:hypothetical protein [Saprospiraceae bacterium]